MKSKAILPTSFVNAWALLLSSITTTSRIPTCDGLIPASPREQTSRAIASIKSAIQDHREQQQQQNADSTKQKPCRLFVDYIIPLPPETLETDVDPWPGGLAQMYPYAEDILKEILQGVVDVPQGVCSTQVLSDSDCCGLFIQESQTSPSEDIAAILFPSVDQLNTIEQVDNMVGSERTLILFNKQFQRPSDFGMGFFSNNGSQKAQTLIFDQYKYGFAFQEFACRGEDTKLLYEHPKGWYSCVICDEDVDAGRQELQLLPPTSSLDRRPTYKELETKINEILPEPLWMRKMNEAESKGLKFQRGGGSGK